MKSTHTIRRDPAGGRSAALRAGSLVALLAGLLLPGCSDLLVPDFNNPSIEDLEGSPTAPQIANAALGVLVTTRVNYADYIKDLGILGREAYDLDAADPRFVTELLGSRLDPGSRAFGGDHWYEPYAAIRTANLLLNALDRVPTTATPSGSGLTAEQKEAYRGFTKTLQALNFLFVVNTRDTEGAPIDVNRPINELAPIVSKDAVFAHIAQLLDEARDHLTAGGDAFAFQLPSGFGGFDTPATFLLFNRALKARVDVYRSDFGGALQSLNESFLVDCGAFDLGVYFSYSTAAGDQTNGLFEDPATADLRAHPSVETFAEQQPGGELDRRVLEKTFETEPKTQLGHTSDLTFTIYQNAASSIPIIRNEELILLRAEANIGLGDVSAAAGDINCIREQVGGLAPRNDLTAANALDELLQQKFFSLLLEGGHRWVDFRRYGKLGELPIDVAGDVVHALYPIPRDEELARQ